MANVYLAKDIILERDVAVKILRPDFSNDEEFIHRFHREAHSATSLNHPNIVSIYDVGEEEDIYYIVMEYVHGVTLKQLIQQQGPLDVNDTVKIMEQLAAAMDHAHQNQIIHRDIKPHNILIDDNGNVKVTDFGIAMALSSTSITQTNSVLGSVHYLSPEQARGGSANKKSDIYSLGIVMYELLTGRLPFSGESAISIALKHLQSEAPSPRRWNPAIPQSVENIILRAMAKDPFHRYESAKEMKDDLHTALHPDRRDEPRFNIPIEDGEVTKAIPIITGDHFQGKETDETIVHTKDIPIKNSSSPKKRSFLSVFIGLTLIFVIAGFAIAWFLPSFLEQEDVEIPNLSQKDITIAVSELTSLGLNVKTEQRNDEEIKAGYVIGTDPAANTIVKKGSTVTIFESLGREKVKFDDYVGRQIDDVRRELEAKGYVKNNIRAYSVESKKPENQIVSQQPLPGELINPEEYKEKVIIFEISKGPKIIVPDLTGWSEEEVMNFIEKNKLNLDNTNEKVFSMEAPNGTVVSQNPKPNTEVEKGATIEITLSKGPEPKTITRTEIVPFDPQFGEEKQRVDIFINDLENDITNIYKTVWITQTEEISFDVVVPYEGQASYKVYRNDKFLVGDVIRYELLP